MFETIGWVAVVLTQVFYIPNTLKILRTHDVQGYSVTAWAMLFVGLGCYLIYFASRGDVVGVVANVCGMTGSGLTLGCIWLWRNGPREHRPTTAAAAATAPGTAIEAGQAPLPADSAEAGFPAA